MEIGQLLEKYFRHMLMMMAYKSASHLHGMEQLCLLEATINPSRKRSSLRHLFSRREKNDLLNQNEYLLSQSHTFVQNLPFLLQIQTPGNLCKLGSLKTRSPGIHSTFVLANPAHEPL